MSRKCPSSRKKLFHVSALFSLFWSIFYGVRVVFFALTAFRYGDERENLSYVQWEVIECLLSALGVLISLSLFNAYKMRGSTLMIFSWLSWMFANFMISLLLLHKCMFDLAMHRSKSTVTVINDVIDMAHIFNAPSSIYFILAFIAGCFGSSPKKGRNVLFGSIKTPLGYRKLDKCEVLHLHPDLVDEEVVYYV